MRDAQLCHHRHGGRFNRRRSALGQCRLGTGRASQPGSPAVQAPCGQPLLPFDPGLVTRLRGTDEGERYRETVRVTAQTRVILGVHDHRGPRRRPAGRRHRSRRRPATGTPPTDDGNVWYFGEATATYDEDGTVGDTARLVGGRCRRCGRRASSCRPTRAHRPPPTWSSPRARPRTRRGSCSAWRSAGTSQWSVRRRRAHAASGARLEPGVVSEKFYARGLGIVLEKDLSGGDERFWLVSSTAG